MRASREPLTAIPAAYGARPTKEFIRLAWPTLLESWLRIAKESRELIVQAMHVPKARRKMKISKGAKRRRLDAKKRRGEIKSNRRYSGD